MWLDQFSSEHNSCDPPEGISIKPSLTCGGTLTPEVTTVICSPLVQNCQRELEKHFSAHTRTLETIWLVFIWYLCWVNLKVSVWQSRNCWKIRACARVVYFCCGLLRSWSSDVFELIQGNAWHPPEAGIFKLTFLITKTKRNKMYSCVRFFFGQMYYGNSMQGFHTYWSKKSRPFCGSPGSVCVDCKSVHIHTLPFTSFRLAIFFNVFKDLF